MAHFALTVDPDPRRRTLFLRTARQRLSAWPHLKIEQRELGDLAIIWGAFPGAPLSWSSTAEAAAFALGDAIQDSGCRLEAADLLQTDSSSDGRLPACDGFYLLARFEKRTGVRMSADPLGLFPLYFRATPRGLIATSSVHLVAEQAGSTWEVDETGLAGILLTNGLVGERTLRRGWRRLEPGCELGWQAGETERVHETYRLPVHGSYRDLSFAEALHLVDERLTAAVRRHAPPGRQSTVLLSGGLDSRLLAGYLAGHALVGSATVWGRASDFECRAAIAVARELGLPWVVEKQEPTPEEFVQAARSAAVWEQLAGGLGAVETSVEASGLGQTAPFCWGGYIGDATLGGTGLEASWDAARQQPTFEHFLVVTNGWGVPVEQLGPLMRAPDAYDLVRSVCEQLRRAWDSGDAPLAHRATRMRLHLRVRCHIGIVLHRLSMHCWPLLPFVDRRLLDVVLNLNPQHVHERHLEHALLAKRFPALTAIAQDTNSFRFERPMNLVAGKQSAWRHSMASLRRAARTWYWRRWRRLDPRRYHRYFDPDGEYWRAVRLAAEPLRPGLAPWLNPAALERLWPRPELPLNCSNPFSGGGALRLLTGLAFCTAGLEATRSDPADT